MVSGGPSQVPVVVLPHQAEGKEEFVTSRRFSPTFIGVLAAVVMVSVALVGVAIMNGGYWYIGAAILLVLVAAFFLIPSRRR